MFPDYICQNFDILAVRNVRKNNFGFHGNRKTQGHKHQLNNLYFKYQVCQMKWRHLNTFLQFRLSFHEPHCMRIGKELAVNRNGKSYLSVLTKASAARNTAEKATCFPRRPFGAETRDCRPDDRQWRNRWCKRRRCQDPNASMVAVTRWKARAPWIAKKTGNRKWPSTMKWHSLLESIG